MKSQTTEIPDGVVASLHQLYRQNKYLTAYESTRHLGSFENWTGTDALLIAGRLAAQLGSNSLRQKLIFRAYRHDPTHPEAQYYFAWATLEMRGPLAAWRFLKERCDHNCQDVRIRSDILALQARVAYFLRDFETAEGLLNRAEETAPGRAWIQVERAYLLEAEDKYDAALQMACLALRKNSDYRPALHAAAHMYQLLNRDEDALTLLTCAAERFEGTGIVSALAGLQFEMKRFGEARNALDRCAAQAPLMDARFTQWIQALRADVEYYCGNMSGAAEFARQVEGTFYKEFAERLSEPGAGENRVEFSVPFVRQHHMTCAPATLTAISRFWGKPSDHLEVAEVICYDGTPAHSERSWAERNGWVVKEFKVTQGSAEQLLRRGIPFTLTTVEPGSAHLQAVIGFDHTRHSLIVRDPFRWYTHEFQSAKTLEFYRSSGPRGMVLVPEERSSLLDGIELPEVELYDILHELNEALEKHHRALAAQALERLVIIAPEHRLTLQAQRTLAAYDGNYTGQLAAVEKLLLQFPEDVNLQLNRIGLLRHVTTREKRFQELKDACAKTDSHPLLWQDYAYELSQDGREYRNALRWIRRANRCRTGGAQTLYLEANLLWNERHFAEAAELYRFAATLEDKKEYLSHAYFNACRHLGKTDQAIAFLEDRRQRLGRLSHLPATTLHWAYSELSRNKEALAVLDQAIALRPEDGDLLLYAADVYARFQDHTRADTLLQKGKGKVAEVAWLRTAAGMAGYGGNLRFSLETWKQVVALEPLAIDANRATAQLLAEVEGRPTAVRFLEEACTRFSHHFGLHALLLEWRQNDGGEAALPILDRIVALDPVNAWARRELAWTLGQLQRFDAAFAEVQRAIEIDPSDPAGFNVRGWLSLQKGEREKARSDFRAAIQLAVDFGSAIEHLLQSCSTLAERKEAVAFVEQELVSQVIYGNGLLAYRDVAKTILNPEEMLASLQRALTARPDLWHGWSVVISQLREMQRYDEAATLAQKATDRFPLLPRLWLDLANVHKARLDVKSEIEALKKAIELSPSWGVPVRQLSEAHERDGNLDEARVALEAHLLRSPLDPYSHGCLADVLWKQGERSSALTSIQQALQCDSNYGWAWNTVRGWSKQLDQPELPLKMAREITARQPGLPQNWLVLADVLDLEKDSEEVMRCFERALELAPRNVDAWDQKATMLAFAGRFAEAQEACHPAVFGNDIPIALRARAAWITMRQGDIHGAIQLMQSVVADDPSHYWAWKQLADWLWQTGAHNEAVTAASQLSRISPFDPVPLGYSGDLKRRIQDHAGAKADFARAMKLAPDYDFAGFSLFDLQLADGEVASAESTLNFLRAHLRSDEFVVRELQLQCERGALGKALDTLQILCQSQEDDDWSLRFAVECLAKKGCAARAEDVLERFVTNPEANPNVGLAWVDCRFAQTRWFFLGNVQKRFAEGEIRQRAMIRYIEVLGELCGRALGERDAIYPGWYRFLLSRVLRKHSAFLRKENRSWGKVGYALTNQRRMKDVVAWLSDWKDRPQVEGWMLHNLALALRSMKRDQEALDVCRRGLTLSFENEIHTSFEVWIAFEEALQGNAESAHRHQSRVKVENLSPYLKWTHTFTSAVLAMHDNWEESRKQRFAKARETLRAQGPGLGTCSKVTRRAYWRTLNELSRDYGSKWPLVWGAYHRFGVLLFSVPLTALSLPLLFIRPELLSIFVFSSVFSLALWLRRNA